MLSLTFFARAIYRNKFPAILLEFVSFLNQLSQYFISLSAENIGKEKVFSYFKGYRNEKLA